MSCVESKAETSEIALASSKSNPHQGKHFYVVPEGYPFIAIALILSLLGWFIHPIVSGLFLGLTAFVVFFFRNPVRSIPKGENLTISPADGKVIHVGLVEEERFLKRKAQKISIFMSPFNVHVNRMPSKGTVKKVQYNKGKFLTAFHKKASLANEQNAIVIENNRGDEILFVQIAGWLARRIVCYAKVGEQWGKGDLFGLIRFGSRLDVYLPLDYKLQVKLGQKVKAGETVLAVYKSTL